ncbi:MAG: hypothetical protein WC719_03700 [Patescibacteria group bacterium]|jgi:hypothetical protein
MNFFSRFKKVFLIIGFLALVFILGYLLWSFFFKAGVITPTATTTPGTVGGLPSAGVGTTTGTTVGEGSGLPGGITIPTEVSPAGGISPTAVGGLTKTSAITKSPTLGSTLSSDGKVQYYDKNDGKFYKVDDQGNVVALSDKVFYGVDSIVWAPDKNQAVIVYPDGNKILYNFQTKSQVTLPSHWQDFSFSPDSNQIVSKSLGLDEENRYLVVSNDDGSKATALENIGTNDKTVYPSWSPNNQIVAMYTEGVDFNRQEVYFVGLNGENFKSTTVEGRGFESKWSTTGDKLLYSVYSTATNLNPQLWVVGASGDTIGQNRQSISLSTWANKCTFASNNEVYCAVPENLSKGAGMFPELADKTKDNLYKINLTTGSKELIAIPDGAYNISEVIVPTSKDSLYFTDKTTDQIYKIDLP